MKNKPIPFGVVLGITILAIGVDTTANAYELATHARLTYRAYAGSLLFPNQNNRLIQDLGIDTNLAFNTNNPFGTIYHDVSGVVVNERTANTFEEDFMKENSNNPNPVIPAGTDPRSLPGWFMRGAIREDDVQVIEFTIGGTHDRDPYGNSIRVLNHFYDPVHDIPLTQITALGHKAPDWALGTANVFTQPNIPETGRRNHFTVLDAREALWRALTLKRRNADGTWTDILPSGHLTTTEAVRNAYWATTFRALGDVLHLNQDMAQPQHTRNEVHSGVGPQLVQALLTGHASIYERYVEARAKGSAEFKIDGTIVTPPGLIYGSYPLPIFPRYSDYWSTSPGPGSLTGKGLADYSNHGFFTTAHNLGNRDYDSPPNTSLAFTPTTIPYLLPAGRRADMVFLSGSVIDNQTGTVNTIRQTTQSQWDNFLTGSVLTYSLTRGNYDDMADLLIPRAVAYSAGLLNHFFRGRLDIALPKMDALNPSEGIYSLTEVTAASGFKTLRLSLTNTSRAGEDMTGGNVVAVAKFHRNTCFKPDLSGEYGLPGNDYARCRNTEEEIVVSAPQSQPLNLAVGQTAFLAFDFSQSPIPLAATDLYLQVVYRGPLGQEADAVVVTTRDIAEPTFIDLANMTDYFLLNGVFYKYPPGPVSQENWRAQGADPALFDYTFNNPLHPFPNVVTTNGNQAIFYNLDFGGSTSLSSFTLPTSSYTRLAILTDTTPYTLHVSKDFHGLHSGSQTLLPNINQNDPVNGPTFTPPTLSRGTYIYFRADDFGFDPALIPIPLTLAPLLSLNPQPVTLHYPPLYTVSVTVSGLVGLYPVPLRLVNNGGEYIATVISGTFFFDTAVASGTPYNIAITVLPVQNNAFTTQPCSVVNGTGVVGHANVIDIQIVCLSNGTYTVTWDAAADPVSRYELEQASNNTFSDATLIYSGLNRSFTINGRPPGAYYYRVRACNGAICRHYASAGSANVGSLRDGDLNGDGIVDIADVLLAERIAIGLAVPSASQQIKGDVAPANNPDGVIDAADVARLRRKVLGLENF